MPNIMDGLRPGRAIFSEAKINDSTLSEHLICLKASRKFFATITDKVIIGIRRDKFVRGGLKGIMFNILADSGAAKEQYYGWYYEPEPAPGVRYLLEEFAMQPRLAYAFYSKDTDAHSPKIFFTDNAMQKFARETLVEFDGNGS